MEFILENIKNYTLTTIKEYIKNHRGQVTPQMKAALIVQATRCFEEIGIDRPAACGAGYVIATISNAQYR